MLVTVTADHAEAPAVTAIDTFNGEEFSVEVLKVAGRSLTFRLTSPSHGGTLLQRLWLDSTGRGVMTLQYDQRWERVLRG